MKDKLIRRFSEDLRERIVEQIENGTMSIAETAREYGTNKSTVKNWLSEYGRFRPKHDIVEVVMKDEKEKIAELQKALADAHLKLRIYDKIIEYANKEYKTDLKKNIGTKELESLTEKASK